MTGWASTRRVRVELVLSGARTLQGDVHVQLMAQHHSGAESPADLLNRNEAFFALTLDGEQPLFVAKHELLFMRLPPQPAIEDPERASAARRVELELELSDGSRLEGVVMIELPPDRPRALDFLNSAPRFFAIWTPDAVRIVNRDHLRVASPLLDLSRAAP